MNLRCLVLLMINCVWFAIILLWILGSNLLGISLFYFLSMWCVSPGYQSVADPLEVMVVCSAFSGLGEMVQTCHWCLL